MASYLDEQYGNRRYTGKQQSNQSEAKLSEASFPLRDAQVLPEDETRLNGSRHLEEPSDEEFATE